MIRILVSSSRVWREVPLLAAGLDAAAEGHDQVTLIHGRCDPRATDAGYIAQHGTDRVPWDEALARPEYGPFVGGDWHAHQHALAHDWAVEAYAANWAMYGKAAGGIRNQHMVNLRPAADVLVAAPLGRSPGTRDCMRRARAADGISRLLDGPYMPTSHAIEAALWPSGELVQERMKLTGGTD